MCIPESITLTQIIVKYLEARRAARYSEHTLADYQHTYNRFIKWMGDDPPIDQIAKEDITRFMASCQDVSKKTALNYHIGLSSLWQWMVESGIVETNIVRGVQPPKPEQREINPFTRAEIVALLEAGQAGRQPKRDRSIILLLLDTGMRATEIVTLRMRDISLAGRRLLVMGKGDKERKIVFSERTKAALAEYLQEIKRSRISAVFLSDRGTAMTRDGLRLLFERLGERAGVIGAHPHRCRHTFAIQFLRNGGNIYALQKILGHTTLDMVKRYLAIVQADIESAMERASPVERWEL